MTKSARFALVILLLFAALCGGWVLSLDPKERFTTDITELLPADERDPEARLVVSLARERQARVILAILDLPKDTAPAVRDAASSAYVAALRESPAFVSAHVLSDRGWQHQLGQLLHARRFELLLPGWLAEQRRAYAAETRTESFPDWLARESTERLDAWLVSPQGSATADLLTSDPLLWLPALSDRASELAPAPVLATTDILVWAETRAGPLSEEGQEPVFAALAAAESAARQLVPGATARHTGVHRFAAAAKSSTKDEISLLNTLALGAVVVIVALCVRRRFGVLHLVPLVLLSSLGATAVTTAIFPRVHVLVFVLGALLCGVAVDYAFHVVLARRPGENYAARVRRIALPLLGGAGTTIGGFLALTLSELPLVQQLGVYVAAGALIAFFSTLLYFRIFPNLDLAPREWPVPPRGLALRWRTPLILTFAAFTIIGLLQVRWLDDLRTLEYPSPELRANDAAIRTAFGENDSGASFITRGSTFAEARTRWTLLADAAPTGSPLAGVAILLPSPDDYAAANRPEARDDFSRFVAAFGVASEEAGFERSELAPFYRDASAYLARPAAAYETLASETLAALPGPLGLLAHGDHNDAWFLSVSKQPFTAPASAIGSVSLSGIENLNSLFARYRISTARLSLIGIGVLVLISCGMHGIRGGLRAAALPLLSTGLAFAIIAVCGQPFGLFHLLGALLGVCIADDYAHFAHADDGAPNARASIRLSALTTAASFAALAFSAIPAVASLGLAVSLIIVFALVFVETDLFSLRAHA
ncbi:MAG: MMPL family transporter [Rariglobus sp.]